MFTVEQTYDLATLTALCRASRKTVRRVWRVFRVVFWVILVYTVTTDTTETKYQYENITSLCETDRYFIFFLGKRHGQVFDKQGFRQGDPDAFRVWLGQKTGKTVQTIQ